MMVEEKSNESPATPEIIEALGLKVSVFTLDTELCQKRFFRTRWVSFRIAVSPPNPGSP